MLRTFIGFSGSQCWSTPKAPSAVFEPEYSVDQLPLEKWVNIPSLRNSTVFSNNSPHYQGKKHISEGISNMVDIEQKYL